MPIESALLEILRLKATAAAEEMALTVIRTARTIYVKEVADFGTAIAGLDGHFFAYPEAIGVSAFVALDLTPAIRAVPDLAPGDVIMTNQPYLSGGVATHLPDLQFIRPYFHADQIVGYGWSFAHTSDIGGGVPSSISPRFSEIFQEGMQIPPVRIMRDGAFVDDVLRLYLANCRTPEMNLGDVKALLAALDVGARRVDDIIAVHGVSAFLEAQSDIARYAAEKAQAVLAQLRDGTYTFWDYLDHDFVSAVPVRIRCAMTVADKRISLDFTGTDPQVASAYNIPTAGTVHPYFTLRFLNMVTSHDRSAPINHGLVTAIDAKAPQGSLINPQFPAATGVRHATVMRLVDAISGAILQANPAMVPVASGGTVLPVVIADRDPASGIRRSMVIQSLICGSGARDGSDGVDGRESALSNTQNSPIELTEDEAGVRVEYYGLRPDSSGVGRWRGGLGLIYTIRILVDDAAVLARGLERFVFRPWGLSGGGAGAHCRVVLNIDTSREREITRVDMLELARGETITFMTPGGGGFGDPFSRPLAAVARDVAQGFVSRAVADEQYGVVFDQNGVDPAASEARRRHRARPASPGFAFGPERALWESVFSDDLVTRLNAHLMQMSPAVRSARRDSLYRHVAPDLGAADFAAVIPDPMRQHGLFRAAVEALEAGRAFA